jgi:hypothetical protein
MKPQTTDFKKPSTAVPEEWYSGMYASLWKCRENSIIILWRELLCQVWSNQNGTMRMCGHNLVGVIHQVSDHQPHHNGSDWLPVLPTNFISSQWWVSITVWYSVQNSRPRIIQKTCHENMSEESGCQLPPKRQNCRTKCLLHPDSSCAPSLWA